MVTRREVLIEFFKSEGLRFNEHGFHGLYFTVYPFNMHPCMVDCSPEDLKPGENKETTVVVRGPSHYWENPTRMLTIDLQHPNSLDELKRLLKSST